MIPTIIIGICILLYTIYVVRKKVRDIKNGKFCSCGCGECGKKCATKIPEE